MDLVVASNLEHANALSHWLGLDEETTLTAVYGQNVVGRLFNNVYLARPISGVEESHMDWVLKDLKPRVAGRIVPMAPCWGQQFRDAA